METTERKFTRKELSKIFKVHEHSISDWIQRGLNCVRINPKRLYITESQIREFIIGDKNIDFINSPIYTIKEVCKILNIKTYDLHNNVIRNNIIRYFKVGGNLYFDEVTLHEFIKFPFVKLRGGYKVESIINDIETISNEYIKYNDNVYKSHPIHKNYYFSYTGTNIVIYKSKNKYFLHKVRKLKTGKMTTRIHTGKNKRLCSLLGKFVLETYKGINKGKLAGHFDDINENNNITNLIWLTDEENRKLYSINNILCKLIYYNLNQNSIDKSLIKILSKVYDNVYITKDGNNVFLNEKKLNVYSEYRYNILYKCVTINKKQYFVHTLMAIAKYGEIDKPNVVRHINDISWDNSFDNIEIGDIANNIKHKSLNYKKYKNFRRNLMKSDYEKYKIILDYCVKLLPDKFKELYYKIQRIILEQNYETVAVKSLGSNTAPQPVISPLTAIGTPSTVGLAITPAAAITGVTA